jgi:hypothetical protein
MKKLLVHARLLMASAFAIALVGCGGGSVSNVALNGTITGLTTDGLMLALNNTSNTSLAANTTAFALPRIAPGASYSIAVATQPPGLNCRVANAAGVAGTGDITNVQVTCVPTNSLGGTITGLIAGGLVLANGSDTVSPAVNSTSFVFPTKVGDGYAYGVTVLTQPAGLTCSLQNGAGIMGPADVASVSVTCS